MGICFAGDWEVRIKSGFATRKAWTDANELERERNSPRAGRWFWSADKPPVAVKPAMYAENQPTDLGKKVLEAQCHATTYPKLRKQLPWAYPKRKRGPKPRKVIA